MFVLICMLSQPAAPSLLLTYFPSSSFVPQRKYEQSTESTASGSMVTRQRHIVFNFHYGSDPKLDEMSVPAAMDEFFMDVYKQALREGIVPQEDLSQVIDMKTKQLVFSNPAWGILSNDTIKSRKYKVSDIGDIVESFRRHEGMKPDCPNINVEILLTDKKNPIDVRSDCFQHVHIPGPVVFSFCYGSSKLSIIANLGGKNESFGDVYMRALHPNLPKDRMVPTDLLNKVTKEKSKVLKFCNPVWDEMGSHQIKQIKVSDIVHMVHYKKGLSTIGVIPIEILIEDMIIRDHEDDGEIIDAHLL